MALGKEGEGKETGERLLEPLSITMRTDKRAGLTLSTRSPPLTNDDDQPSKRLKELPESDFRTSVIRRQEVKRMTGELYRARRTVQTLDEGAGRERHGMWIEEKKKEGGEEGTEVVEVVEEEVEEIQEEPDVKLRRELLEVVRYLRTMYFYCLWCGDRFKDEAELTQYCPGEWKDDHDD
ncbi:hypothetical protein BC829DRAFT_116678 [Chytridium lagenaria]|nr:hypothetical protein BC829DRAFT_116678 [Chytridium lagenaria]